MKRPTVLAAGAGFHKTLDRLRIFLFFMRVVHRYSSSYYLNVLRIQTTKNLSASREAERFICVYNNIIPLSSLKAFALQELAPFQHKLTVAGLHRAQSLHLS